MKQIVKAFEKELARLDARRARIIGILDAVKEFDGLLGARGKPGRKSGRLKPQANPKRAVSKPARVTPETPAPSSRAWTDERRAKFRRTMQAKRGQKSRSQEGIDRPVISESVLDPAGAERDARDAAVLEQLVKAAGIGRSTQELAILLPAIGAGQSLERSLVRLNAKGKIRRDGESSKWRVK